VRFLKPPEAVSYPVCRGITEIASTGAKYPRFRTDRSCLTNANCAEDAPEPRLPSWQLTYRAIERGSDGIACSRGWERSPRRTFSARNSFPPAHGICTRHDGTGGARSFPFSRLTDPYPTSLSDLRSQSQDEGGQRNVDDLPSSGQEKKRATRGIPTAEERVSL
jgi:hypothetical protein